jgi:hypothetical protein
MKVEKQNSKAYRISLSFTVVLWMKERRVIASVDGRTLNI